MFDGGPHDLLQASLTFFRHLRDVKTELLLDLRIAALQELLHSGVVVQALLLGHILVLLILLSLVVAVVHRVHGFKDLEQSLHARLFFLGDVPLHVQVAQLGQLARKRIAHSVATVLGLASATTAIPLATRPWVRPQDLIQTLSTVTNHKKSTYRVHLLFK